MTVNPAAGVISGTTFRVRSQLRVPDRQERRCQGRTAIDSGSVQGLDRRAAVLQRPRHPGRRRQPDRSTGTTGGVVEQARCQDVCGACVMTRSSSTSRASTAARTFCQAGDKDFFNGLNASAIAVEVPTSMLGSGPIGVWGRTVVDDQQIDRMGRPAILTVFIPPNPFEAGSTADGNLEDQFNATKPNKDQARWRGRDRQFVDAPLQPERRDRRSQRRRCEDPGAGRRSASRHPHGRPVARRRASSTVETSADDVIDAELGLVTEGLHHDRLHRERLDLPVGLPVPGSAELGRHDVRLRGAHCGALPRGRTGRLPHLSMTKLQAPLAPRRPSQWGSSSSAYGSGVPHRVDSKPGRRSDRRSQLCDRHAFGRPRCSDTDRLLVDARGRAARTRTST